MARSIVALLLIIFTVFLIFAISDKTIGAQAQEEADELKQVIQNQKLVLEKLDAIDKKLDIIKMRIRL